MNLAISNIAWSHEEDSTMYNFLMKSNYKGLEIAPTRIFLENPYENIAKAKDYAKMLIENYGLEICSMQSIWFGRKEKLFGSNIERKILLDYTKKAIDFAFAISCKNLVLGSPKNRCFENSEDLTRAIAFFKELGDYAFENDTVLSMEANPKIYGTNYINTTFENVELVEKVNSHGFMMNLDIGTIIQNSEKIDSIIGNLGLINHVHVSEPYLAKLKKRKIHKVLSKILKENNYEKFVSIEMWNLNNLEDVKQSMSYIEKVF